MKTRPTKADATKAKAHRIIAAFCRDLEEALGKVRVGRNEANLQFQVHRILAKCDRVDSFKAEHRLNSSSRLDFLVWLFGPDLEGGCVEGPLLNVALELKVAGSVAEVERQVFRYLRGQDSGSGIQGGSSETAVELDAAIVISSAPSIQKLNMKEVDGKPVHLVRLWKGGLL